MTCKLLRLLKETCINCLQCLCCGVCRQLLGELFLKISESNIYYKLFDFFLSPANHLLYGNRALCLILTKQYK